MVWWLLRGVEEEVGSISEGYCDVCQSVECSNECLEPSAAPDDHGAGDELDADEDILVDVTSGGSDVDKALHENATNEDLCVD